MLDDLIFWRSCHYYHTIELSIYCHLEKVEKTNKIHKSARTILDKVDKQEHRNVITKEIGKITEKISPLDVRWQHIDSSIV
jgi:hypothetical protein